MKLKLLCALLILFGVSVSAFSQTVSFEGKIAGTVPQGMKVYVIPAGMKQSNPDTLAVANGHYSTTATESKFGFYNIVSVYHGRQSIIPITVGQGKHGKALQLYADTMGIRLFKPDKDNKALSVFYDGYVNRSKDFWINGRSMSNEQLKNSIASYQVLADSVIEACRPDGNVAEYLRILATSLSFESMNSLRFATGHSASQIGINYHDEAAKWLKAIDCPMASLFDAAGGIVIAACREKGLEKRFAEIATLVSDTSLQRKARLLLLRHWIAGFNYQNNFQAGLQTLRTLTAKYGIDGKFLRDFEAKGSAVAGKLFPLDVKLYGVDGKEVSFDKFRGKYVYIDMWASWCMPCIREIPYLKQLEKDINNDKVVFVSISIDTNTDAWKNKVKQLDLYGNQLINNDNSLARALNVNAIPRFIIYDPQGNLYNGDAPRPSDAGTKTLLENLGK